MILFNECESTTFDNKSERRRKSLNSILKNQKLFISTINFFQSKRSFRKYSSSFKTEMDEFWNNKKDRTKSSLQNYLSPALKIKQINSRITINEEYFASTKYSKKTETLQQQSNKIYEIVKEQKKSEMKYNKQKKNYYRNREMNKQGINIKSKEMITQSDSTRHIKLQFNNNVSQTTIFTSLDYFTSEQKYINFLKPLTRQNLRYLSEQKLNKTYHQEKSHNLFKQSLQKKSLKQIGKQCFTHKKIKQAHNIRQKLARQLKKKTSLCYSKNKTYREDLYSTITTQQFQHQAVNKNKFKNNELLKKQYYSRNSKVIKKSMTHTLMIEGSMCHKL